MSQNIQNLLSYISTLFTSFNEALLKIDKQVYQNKLQQPKKLFPPET